MENEKTISIYQADPTLLSSKHARRNMNSGVLQTRTR
jgi:hypothetical protein